MVRQAHHQTTLSQVEGQITMTEIQNPKLILVNDYGKLDSRYLIFDVGCSMFDNYNRNSIY
jgi:hypothetical protein